MRRVKHRLYGRGLVPGWGEGRDPVPVWFDDMALVAGDMVANPFGGMPVALVPEDELETVRGGKWKFGDVVASRGCKLAVIDQAGDSVRTVRLDTDPELVKVGGQCGAWAPDCEPATLSADELLDFRAAMQQVYASPDWRRRGHISTSVLPKKYFEPLLAKLAAARVVEALID